QAVVSAHGSGPGCAGVTADRARRRAQVNNDRQQALHVSDGLRLSAEDLRGIAERSGDRSTLRRPEPEAADVLLPQAALSRCANQLLRSRRTGGLVSSFARILPFVKPLEHLLLDPTVTEVMVNAGGRRV